MTSHAWLRISFETVSQWPHVHGLNIHQISSIRNRANYQQFTYTKQWLRFGKTNSSSFSECVLDLHTLSYSLSLSLSLSLSFITNHHPPTSSIIRPAMFWEDPSRQHLVTKDDNDNDNDNDNHLHRDVVRIYGLNGLCHGSSFFYGERRRLHRHHSHWRLLLHHHQNQRPSRQPLLRAVGNIRRGGVRKKKRK